MAELVDALDSGSSRGNSVEVRVFLAAMFFSYRSKGMKPFLSLQFLDTPLTSEILLIANGYPPSPSLIKSLLSSKKTLIAVDGGLNSCEELGLKPDLILGDFDSAKPGLLDSYPQEKKVHLPNPDKTDLEKALEFLFLFPINRVTVCGALGRRLDHTLTNLALLARYPEKMTFQSEFEHCYALQKTTTLECLPGQTLSLIPIGSEVKGLTTEGLKWELKDATLNNHFLSTSNIAMQRNISISFKKGDLLVCLSKVGITES